MAVSPELDWLISTFRDGGPRALTWKALLQPMRKQYSQEQLGEKLFFLNGHPFHREDVQVTNERGYRLSCSHFLPANQNRRPCVVYLHGHGSARPEVVHILPTLLQMGLSVFCFDSTGAGCSEGEYCTAGFYEERDLAAVLEHLQGQKSVSSIALWGRSSGAVACMLRVAKEPNSVAAVFLDSPFCNFRRQLEEVLSGRLHLPVFIAKRIIDQIRDEGLARTGFDVNEHSPIKVAHRSSTPAFFAAGVEDEVVQYNHTEELFKAWGSFKKKIVTFPGSHNTRRPQWLIEMGAHFLLQFLSGIPCPSPIVRRPPCGVEAKPVLSSGPVHHSAEPAYNENAAGEDDGQWVEIDLDLILDIQDKASQKDNRSRAGLRPIVVDAFIEGDEQTSCSDMLSTTLTDGIVGLAKCMRTSAAQAPEAQPSESTIFTLEAV
mmetsp:Transcript_11877/g.27682  ORF Transcript_11877/g.27682 Transcript_11877/m.27682 type:complete len:432 (-) Transcript_11877:87-1382(-)